MLLNHSERDEKCLTTCQLQTQVSVLSFTFQDWLVNSQSVLWTCWQTFLREANLCYWCSIQNVFFLWVWGKNILFSSLGSWKWTVSQEGQMWPRPQETGAMEEISTHWRLKLGLPAGGDFLGPSQDFLLWWRHPEVMSTCDITLWHTSFGVKLCGL